MTTPTISGIHHVTAITADAQRNVDFYTGVLGLRLVKRTVNFDDPGTYHLYYGDALGRPGTILTFFAWPGGYPGRIGPPQVTATALAVPAAALDFWSTRLSEHGVQAQPAEDRLGERALAFADPDGMRIEIVGVDQPAPHVGAGGPVAADHAIRGFHSVTIAEEGYENSAKLLTEVMGFQAGGSEGNRFRYRAGGANSDGFAAIVDLVCAPDARHGSGGAGVVHHVAFRTPDNAQQLAWRTQLAALGYNVSPIMDRSYFHSIYFREPGGVLFEIATDPPGFALDEPADQLGTRLMLPPFVEPHRAEVERVLPPLRLPRWASA